VASGDNSKKAQPLEYEARRAPRRRRALVVVAYGALVMIVANLLTAWTGGVYIGCSWHSRGIAIAMFPNHTVCCAEYYYDEEHDLVEAGFGCQGFARKNAFFHISRHDNGFRSYYEVDVPSVVVDSIVVVTLVPLVVAWSKRRVR